jgi:hypothetical protein
MRRVDERRLAGWMLVCAGKNASKQNALALRSDRRRGDAFDHDVDAGRLAAGKRVVDRGLR